MRAMHDEIETAKFLVDGRGERGNLIVVGHIARENERILEFLGELADVFLEPLGRIRQREPGALGIERLRNAPGNGSAIGDADDETEFSCERHRSRRRSRR